MKTSQFNFLTKGALFLAALIWGSSFFIMKNTVDVFPPNILLGFRFTLGCAILCIVFFKRLKNINIDYVKRGAIIGLLLYLAYSMQTMGLVTTTPGKNAFLTAIYCVLVPFLYWITDKSRPDRYNFTAAVLCFLGIGFVSLTEAFTIGIGDALTLVGGFFYAAHMISVAKLGRERDPIIITILQFAFCAVYSWIVALFTEQMPSVIGSETWGGLLYLAALPTAGALLLQIVGQKYVHPSSAAIILSLESVFGVAFSMICYGETLTPKLAIGFSMIFIAVIISETKLSFLRKKPNIVDVKEKT